MYQYHVRKPTTCTLTALNHSFGGRDVWRPMLGMRWRSGCRPARTGASHALLCLRNPERQPVLHGLAPCTDSPGGP